MKRLSTIILLVVASMMLAAPGASAHLLHVEHPRTGEIIHMGWVGGEASFAPHGGGLVTACEAPGSGAAMIFTNWNPLNGCTHFGP